MARPERGDTSVGGSTRGEPKWARGLNPSEVLAEQEARRLPVETDPDAIEDSDVRDRFLARLHRIEEGTERLPRRHRVTPSPGAHPSGRPAARRATGGRAGSRTRPAAGRFSHPLHWSTGARGHVVGRPTLTPPSGVNVRDWTGFGFGLVLYALAFSYIRYGPGGPTMWLRAKFINQTAGGTDTAGRAYGKGQQQALQQLLVDPIRKPKVAPPPAVTPPGSLGWIWAQPGSKQ